MVRATECNKNVVAIANVRSIFATRTPKQKSEKKTGKCCAFEIKGTRIALENELNSDADDDADDAGKTHAK